MFSFTKSYTVESVTNGHPDKICDQISDAILDECLKQDPDSRVAVETMGSHGLIIVAGEITTKADINPAQIATKVYRHIGYIDKIKVISHITKQSADISQGVDTGGAGDQGIMYGYATDETADFLPLGVSLVNRLTFYLQGLREKKILPWLMPDGKAQVTIKGKKVVNVLVSTQHKKEVKQQQIVSGISQKLIRPSINNGHNYQININPTGKFILGGFSADTGLTGRKIMVDTYGGLIPHGGGCFSGKDPSKVDRSAAYMARFAAKNLVAQGYANKCLVSVSYAIGKAEPLMIEAIDQKGKSLSSIVKKKYDFRPKAIIERLDLKKPIYQKTAVYGHFTKPDLPWEQLEN